MRGEAKLESVFHGNPVPIVPLATAGNILELLPQLVVSSLEGAGSSSLSSTPLFVF